MKSEKSISGPRFNYEETKARKKKEYNDSLCETSYVKILPPTTIFFFC